MFTVEQLKELMKLTSYCIVGVYAAIKLINCFIAALVFISEYIFSSLF